MSPDEAILIGSSLEEAVTQAAGQVVSALAGVAGDRCVALAGGRTPAALYAALARPPWHDRVVWSGVRWFWGDERAVPPDHPASNYRMALESLLAPLSAPADRIHPMPADDADPPAAARRYEQTIRQHVLAGPDGIPVLDLVLLGVGADGHTAGLFAGSAALASRDRLVVAHRVPSLKAWRMTMTLPLLRAARRIVFLVTGPDKADVVSRVLGSRADPNRLPAASLRGRPDRVVWVLDAEAARLVRADRPA